MTIKFAVVGTGWVAGEYMKAILADPEAELSGLVSSNPDRAKQILVDHNSDARCFGTFAEMVKDPQIDAIVLCSTPDVRAEQAILAAQNGKHLVIEKPMAMNKADLWRMAEAITRNPIRTVVSFVLRWNPSFDTTKSLIDNDAIGRIFMAQIDYWHNIGPQYGQFRWSSTKNQGGSSILSAGCHAVDALRYFAGEIDEVTAYSCTTWSNSEYEFDPNALAIFKLKNGGLGKISSSIECKTTYKFNVHLLGEKGSIMDNKLFSHTLPGQTDYAAIPTILPDSGDVSHHPFADEIKEFTQSIIKGTVPRSDFFDAYKTMEVSFAIDESIRSGSKVILSS
ncbi:Gfo/Idh/MocA family protein [Paenibacillus nasutitermitis]|uniref:Gfo/Idh/MocA family oxidoreductase n=1 Tax=Paenibacillus nasutitermitis TaxID=1652958 RepID=A0A916YS73_9BACL|nr:Gfo/Idh/MocA family oxidoreductase [Paenibacillus nasutitermitis]GGD59031.1 hypothetical protein GCM10010911_16090 [Paenibacillus nasutitermitis]